MKEYNDHMYIKEKYINILKTKTDECIYLKNYIDLAELFENFVYDVTVSMEAYTSIIKTIVNEVDVINIDKELCGNIKGYDEVINSVYDIYDSYNISAPSVCSACLLNKIDELYEKYGLTSENEMPIEEIFEKYGLNDNYEVDDYINDDLEFSEDEEYYDEYNNEDE